MALEKGQKKHCSLFNVYNPLFFLIYLLYSKDINQRLVIEIRILREEKRKQVKKKLILNYYNDTF